MAPNDKDGVVGVTALGEAGRVALNDTVEGILRRLGSASVGFSLGSSGLAFGSVSIFNLSFLPVDATTGGERGDSSGTGLLVICTLGGLWDGVRAVFLLLLPLLLAVWEGRPPLASLERSARGSDRSLSLCWLSAERRSKADSS